MDLIKIDPISIGYRTSLNEKLINISRIMIGIEWV